MLKEALTYLVGLAKPEKLELNGRTFLMDKSGGYYAVPEPWPNPLDVSTLTALVDLLVANKDGLNLAEVYIHVEGPCNVSVVRKLSGPENQRTVLYSAFPMLPESIVGAYLDLEEFRIGLMSGFDKTGGYEDVLAIAASVKVGAEGQIKDTGITQEFTAKAGVSTVENKRTKPTYDLAPFRTFQEVDQPRSEFIFRLKGDASVAVKAALFEADGGAWKRAAMENVGAWLQQALANIEGGPEGIKEIPVLV